MAEKVKLSVYLVEKGYYPTRSQATNFIKAGKVRVNSRVITKGGYEVNENDFVEVEVEENRYVSRGGYKLEAALKEFRISLENKTVLDIGASTGGFTDCCLQNGAGKVYAYDVGHDQLALKLRNDPAVVAKEGVNARYITKNDFEDSIDFICMDVSFISCTKIFGAISDILTEGKDAVILFKPQFEVGNAHLNKNGIVNDQNAVTDKLNETETIARQFALKVTGKMLSPIKGQDGNQEYLLHLVRE